MLGSYDITSTSKQELAKSSTGADVNPMETTLSRFFNVKRLACIVNCFSYPLKRIETVPFSLVLCF